MNSPNRLIFMEVTRNARVKAHEVMLRRETTHVPARKMREMARKIQGTIRKCLIAQSPRQLNKYQLEHSISRIRKHGASRL